MFKFAFLGILTVLLIVVVFGSAVPVPATTTKTLSVGSANVFVDLAPNQYALNSPEGATSWAIDLTSGVAPNNDFCTVATSFEEVITGGFLESASAEGNVAATTFDPESSAYCSASYALRFVLDSPAQVRISGFVSRSLPDIGSYSNWVIALQNQTLGSCVGGVTLFHVMQDDEYADSANFDQTLNLDPCHYQLTVHSGAVFSDDDGYPSTAHYDVLFEVLSGNVHTCAGLPATIVGTAGIDLINGTSGNDVIVALGGNDEVHGLDGNDIICGGDGKDKLYGEGGKDSVYGDAGNDTLDGGTGNDRVYGGTGNDAVLGGIGNDRLYGEAGIDTVSGGTGTDTLSGGSGDDVLSGNAGDDAMTCGTGTDTANGNAGTDTADPSCETVTGVP